MHFRDHKEWYVGTHPKPTWRDGLGGSDRTYAFVAVPWESRTGYKSIVVGRVYKTNMPPGSWGCAIKFYPNVEALGLSHEKLRDLGFSLGPTRQDYVRYNGTLDKVLELLKSLDPKEWATAPLDINELKVLADFPGEEGRASSRNRHPKDYDFEFSPAEVGESTLAPPSLTGPDDEDVDPDNPDKGTDNKVSPEAVEASAG